MQVRYSTLFCAYLALCLSLLVLTGVHSWTRRDGECRSRELRIELVRRLALTDLCLFTEASYTRQMSLADLHTPFQDHPLAREHFPSGALVAPPGWR